MWVQTLTGRKVDLFRPLADAIDLEGDVAPSLARQPRFNGHTRFAYSVAQHSALGAQYFLRRDKSAMALKFLLHDAHEAYTGDITSPVIAAVCNKAALRQVRLGLDRAIWKAATGDAWASHELIGDQMRPADLSMLRAERDQICARPPEPWDEEIETAQPLSVVITPCSESDACGEWITLLRYLTGRS